MKASLLRLFEKGQVASVEAALAEQKLADMVRRLRALVPDIRDQNTTYAIDTEALEWRVRGLHAFQMTLTLRAIERVLAEPGAAGSGPFTVADIGDSAGTHLCYLDGLLAGDPRFTGRGFESLSVNLDPLAVAKIQAKGLKAVVGRAERLHETSDVRASLFLSFEMLEHLQDPIGFMDAMSRESRCPYFAVTVPYRRTSRVGLQYIRFRQRTPTTPENTHIFELCPADWTLLFQHAGWRVVEQTVYRQYPLRSPLRALAPAWRRFDFEGFAGFILRQDRSWAELYQG